MVGRSITAPPSPQGAPELDELQRGAEPPATVETLEPAAPPVYGAPRTVPVPDPGERPGAVRVDAGPADEKTDPRAAPGVTAPE